MSISVRMAHPNLDVPTKAKKPSGRQIQRAAVSRPFGLLQPWPMASPSMTSFAEKGRAGRFLVRVCGVRRANLIDYTRRN